MFYEYVIQDLHIVCIFEFNLKLQPIADILFDIQNLHLRNPTCPVEDIANGIWREYINITKIVIMEFCDSDRVPKASHKPYSLSRVLWEFWLEVAITGARKLVMVGPVKYM